MPNPDPRDLGELDFEPTDFEEAKRIHDELPAGVSTAHTLDPGYWLRQRRATMARDRALSGATIQWALTLPANLRPKTLIDRFPRIANRLAECWSRPAERDAVLQDLLVDRRMRRRGFPPEVATELQALRASLSAPS